LGDPASLVTLVDGQTFCLSSRSGDFDTNPAHGVYFADMRVLSRAHLRVGGLTVEPLAVQQDDAEMATFVGRCVLTGVSEGNLLVVRRRHIGSVWHEQVEIRNFSPGALTLVVELEVGADFADVFAVKEGRQDLEGQHSVEVLESGLAFSWRLGEINRKAELSASGPPSQLSIQGFRWTAEIPSGDTWSVGLDLSVAVGERWITRRHHHHPDTPGAARRNRLWMTERPRLRSTDGRLAEAFATSIEDLAALRLHDQAGERRPVLAAGAPWYMALFGRDALIASYMALPIDRDLALGVLQALAELQGTVVDEVTEEEPGRIVHETRYLGAERITLTGHSAYYGSIDATPLFVMLLGELCRWGIEDAHLRQLLPHADRALTWMDAYGDRDGDGYIEYERASDRGLVNQGWKDSGDAIRYRDGRIAEAPLALCEVQGYAYAAWQARAAIAERLGDDDTRERCEARAARLKERFNRDFWLDELGWFAVALGPDKQPVDSLTSNIGHCLWSGIVDDEHAEQLAKILLSTQMFTGWGIRTMAADERGFDPMSYHCGSVWPHDGALCAAGLARYGFHDAALTVANGLLDASGSWDGRLPEFFCGLDRHDVATPVPMPTSCSPQAWAAASPLLLVRLMLGLEPDDEHGMRVSPLEGTPDIALLGVSSGTGTWDVRSTDAERGVRPSVG
jgi:glycogen debranching enzyme